MTFNTKYKVGDNIKCIKNLTPQDYFGNIPFIEGQSYPVTNILYSKCGGYPDKTTLYQPFYFVNGNYPFYSPDEKFIVDEESHGGYGMSGCGLIDNHFTKV